MGSSKVGVRNVRFSSRNRWDWVIEGWRVAQVVVLGACHSAGAAHWHRVYDARWTAWSSFDSTFDRVHRIALFAIAFVHKGCVLRLSNHYHLLLEVGTDKVGRAFVTAGCSTGGVPTSLAWNIVVLRQLRSCFVRHPRSRESFPRVNLHCEELGHTWCPEGWWRSAINTVATPQVVVVRPNCPLLSAIIDLSNEN